MKSQRTRRKTRRPRTRGQGGRDEPDPAHAARPAAAPPAPGASQSPASLHSLGIDYFQRWIAAGYEVTFGRETDGHFVRLAAPGGLHAKFSGYASLEGLLTAFLITVRSTDPLVAPDPNPLLEPSTWERFRIITALCQKAVDEGLAPDTRAAHRVIYHMGKEEFLVFRENCKVSRIDFRVWENHQLRPLIPHPPRP